VVEVPLLLKVLGGDVPDVEEEVDGVFTELVVSVFFVSVVAVASFSTSSSSTEDPTAASSLSIC